jgi:hypothetical protein
LLGEAQTPRTLRADEFVLQDENGHPRARLCLEAGDRPALSFYDSHGAIVLSLSGGEEPSLALSRPGSSEHVQLATTKYSYGLALYDAQSHRAGISVQNGVPGVNLFDREGKEGLSAFTNSNGPSFSLRDADGKAGIVLKVAPQSAGPSLVLFDKDGKVLSSAPNNALLEASQPN